MWKNMHVRYTPPLMEQIRNRRRGIADATRGDGRVVIVRAKGRFVPRVDPKTRLATDEPQQFYLGDDQSLSVVPAWAWVLHPTVLDVDTVGYG